MSFMAFGGESSAFLQALIISPPFLTSAARMQKAGRPPVCCSTFPAKTVKAACFEPWKHQSVRTDTFLNGGIVADLVVQSTKVNPFSFLEKEKLRWRGVRMRV